MIPSVGGVSIRMTSYSFRFGVSASLSRKGASNCPTRLASSFASAIFEGTTQRFATLVGRTTSERLRRWSARTSETESLISSELKKVRVLLAWGSRSISRVLLFFRARAAARLMAVVVFPTPPFWFAIAMTVATQNSGRSPPRRVGCRWSSGCRRLHLVSSNVLVVEVLQPLPQLFVADFVRSRAGDLGILQDFVFDINRAVHAQGQRQRVTGTRIDGDHLAGPLQPDQGVKRVVLEVVDDDLIHADFKAEEEVLEQVVGHRSRG